MRNITKNMTMYTVECDVYDRELKQERTLTCYTTDKDNTPEVPAGCAVLEKRIVGQKEVRAIQTPEEFLLHAKIVDKK